VRGTITIWSFLTTVSKVRRGSAWVPKPKVLVLHEKPFLTLLPLAPASTGFALRWLPLPPLVFSTFIALPFGKIADTAPAFYNTEIVYSEIVGVV
jgi:hypothetical protein